MPIIASKLEKKNNTNFVIVDAEDVAYSAEYNEADGQLCSMESVKDKLDIILNEPDIHISADAPANAKDGDLWIATDEEFETNPLLQLSDIANDLTTDDPTKVLSAAMGVVLKEQIAGKTVNVMTGATETQDGTSGAVPMPTAGSQEKFLKGDGTWSEIPDYNDMTGANGATAGTHGLVPAPGATDNTKYLRGDGTWADIAVPKYKTLRSTDVEAGAGVLVPNSSNTETNLYLRGDGSWDAPIHVGTEPENAAVGALWVDTAAVSDQEADPVLQKSDIVNDLTSDNSGRPLSAAQGKVLKGLIESKSFTHATGSGWNHIPIGGASGNVLVWDSDGAAKWDTVSAPEYSTLGNKSSGVLVPSPSDSTDKNNSYLRADGTWSEPPGEEYKLMTDTAATAGAGTLVPKPESGSEDLVLRASGVWSAIVKDEVGIFTSDDEPEGAADGDIWISPNEEPAKNEASYAHPAYAPRSLGFYKFATDEIGGVSEASAVTKQDILDLGISEFSEQHQKTLDASVLTTAQTLTEAQKEQARNNIGISEVISAAIGAAMRSSY